MVKEKKDETQNKEKSEIRELPFPHARIKEILKSKLKEGTYIKKKAAINLNLWLGKLAEEIADEVSKTENAYISTDDIDRVTCRFDAVNKIEKEKKRISAHLNAIKEDINRLVEDLETSMNQRK